MLNSGYPGCSWYPRDDFWIFFDHQIFIKTPWFHANPDLRFGTFGMFSWGKRLAFGL